MVVLETSRVTDRVRDAADAWLVVCCLQHKVATVRRVAFYTPASPDELASGEWIEFEHGERPVGSFAFVEGGLLWLPKHKPSGSPSLGDVIRAAIGG